ncbi:MAG: TonB-dependent receptor [Acidobacteria bacterium]|nr:TonB-dependent receptor [Acidobacteriota bacterium]MBI3428104.1 TonB-dependent receptor [Acidobacteriota bacterium]
MKYPASSRLKFSLLFLTLAIFTPVNAQVPTGSLRGNVVDPSKAIIPGALVEVKSKAAGEARQFTTKNDGAFLISSLLPGEYEVKVTAKGFKTAVSSITIQVGVTSTTEINLEVGQQSETVVISGDSTAVVNPTDFKIDGVISRQKVDGLPLNGRNFLQLAALEPGVRVSTGSPGDANNLFNVSIGGGNSDLTRLTVDGGNIVDPVTGGAAQNFSVDTVQEFQISSFNFDLATGVTSVGAVNIVSRTGSNEYHGTGFGFYRDNHMSAYPTLNRVANNPDPFFRRLQAGFTLGGPIIKDKLVWFTNLERLNQTTAYSTIHTGAPVFQQFDTVSSSPYKGWLYNLRFDYTLNSKHTFFLRYSSDNNRVFAPVTNNVLPSDWRANKNDVYQGQAGWTASWRPNLVNQLSFNYQYIGNKSLIPSTADCPGCIGLGGAQVRVNGSSFVMGNSTDAPQNRALFRYETTDNLTWTKGRHIVQTGLNWEKAYGTGGWSFVDPAIVVTHDPRTVKDINDAIDALAGGLGLPANDPIGQQLRGIFGPVAPSLKLPLPAAFTTPGARITANDILGLPVAFIVRGLGDGSQPPPFNSSFARHTQRWRFYGQDTWNIGKGLTLKYGLSYVYENKLWNHDLKKSSLFANTGLYGTTDPNARDKNNFAPSVGFAYNVKNDNKTVVRGGFSMAYDTSLYVNRLTERAILGPLGNGRVILPGDFFQNTISFPQLPAQVAGALPVVSQALLAVANTPGLPADQRAQLLLIGGAVVPNLGVINPATGARLSAATLQVLPTKLTTAQALQLVAQQGALIQNQFNQLAQAGVIGADFFKTVSQTSVLIDPNIKIPYSTTASIGLQRQLPWNMAVNADFVWRRYLHTFFQRDRALWNRAPAAGGPIVRPCATAAEATNPTVRCLNGPFEVLEGSGRDDYKALLVKLEKRFAQRAQFTASYAYSRLRSFNYTRDIASPFAFPGYAGSDRPHALTFSGLWDIAWGFKAGLIVTYESGAPLSASIPGSNNSDLNGDGSNNDYLPGTGFNTLNRDINADQLRQLVAQYNQSVAGKAAPRGGQFPAITLPSNFDLGDSFQSHDLRLSKEINIVKERLKLELIGEVFNLFNLSNKLGYSGSLDTGFGQPTSKANPILGIGGPRIFQIGGRLKF